MMSPDGSWLATLSIGRESRDELTIHQICGDGSPIQQGKEQSMCRTTIRLSAPLGGEEGCYEAVSWLNNCVLVAGLINGRLDVVESKQTASSVHSQLIFSVSIVGSSSSQSHGNQGVSK